MSINTAVLWDIENVSPQANRNLVQAILDRIRNAGRICCAMAFGDWSNNAIKNIAPELHAHNFRLIHVPNSGKNSADLSLVAHGMETLFKYPHIERYVLISGDADFRDLLMFQKEYGKDIWIICNVQTASKDFLKIADTIIDYGEIINGEKTEPEEITETGSPESKTPEAYSAIQMEALVLLKETITAINAEGKGAYLTDVKEKIPALNEVKSLGFKDWIDFIQKVKAFGILYRKGIFLIQDADIDQTPETEKNTDPAITALLEVIGSETVLLSQLGEKEKKVDYKKYRYTKLMNLISDAEKQGYVTVDESNKSAITVKKK